MAAELSKASDLHLEAVVKTRRINEILTKLLEKEFNPSQEAEIALTVRFFGKNVAKLQECNEAIIKLAQIFLSVKGKFVHWSLRDMNAFLLLITTMLLKRREEVVIRQMSSILIEFAESLSKKELGSLAKLHSKPIILIFHKLSKLSTFYTQMKVVKILFIVASVLEDQGANIIKQERLIRTAGPELAEEAFTHFKNIKREDLLNSSRQFLKFYNEDIMQEPHIFSIVGFLLAVNDDKNLKEAEIIIDFNLRNLSVSFFYSMNQWKDSGDNNDKAVHFIELEDCDFEAVPFKFQDPDHIELTVKPSRWQVLDENEQPVEDFPHIATIQLVVSNKNNLFMWRVFPSLKAKTAMVNDNNMTDQESIVSFQTMATSIIDMRSQMKPNLTFDVIPTIDDPPKSGNTNQPFVNDFSEKIPDQTASLEKTLKKTQIDLSLNATSPSQDPTKSKPGSQRLTAKIGPTFNNVSNPFLRAVRPMFTDYDEIPQDDRLPPFNQFMSHQRNVRRRNIIEGKHQSQDSLVLNLSSAHFLPPPPQARKIKPKSPVVKRKAKPKKSVITKTTPQQAANQSFDYSSVDDDFLEEIVKKFQEKPKRKRAPTVAVDSDEEDKHLKKARKQEAPATKAKTVKPLPEVKPKAAPKVARKKKVVPPSVAAEKTNVKETSYSFASVFGKKSDDSSKDEFDKLRASEKVKASEILAGSKPGPVKLPPKPIVKSVKRPPLNDATNQPAAKKPRVDFSNLPKDPKPEASKQIAKRQKRVSFDNSVQVIDRTATGSFHVEVDDSAGFQPLTQREVDPKKQNRVKPSPILGQHVPVVKTVKQQNEAPLNQAKAIGKGKENPQPNQQLKFPAPKPPKQPEPRQQPKRQENQLHQGTIKEPSNHYQSRQENHNIVYNFDAVEKDGILDMFLNDAMSVEQEKVDYEDSLDENLHIRTRTVHKKMSPTIIRSVQIKEINLISSPVQPVVEKTVAVHTTKGDLDLSKALVKSGNKCFEPLLEKIQAIRESRAVSAPSVEKEMLKKSIAKSRDSKALLKDHVQDHLKLLKRLQLSKRRMMQLYDQDQENMTDLKISLKQVVRITRAACKEEMKEIDLVHKAASEVEKEVKSTVWKAHLDLVSRQMQKTLEAHYKI